MRKISFTSLVLSLAFVLVLSFFTNKAQANVLINVNWDKIEDSSFTSDTETQPLKVLSNTIYISKGEHVTLNVISQSEKPVFKPQEVILKITAKDKIIYITDKPCDFEVNQFTKTLNYFSEPNSYEISIATKNGLSFGTLVEVSENSVKKKQTGWKKITSTGFGVDLIKEKSYTLVDTPDPADPTKSFKMIIRRGAEDKMSPHVALLTHFRPNDDKRFIKNTYISTGLSTDENGGVWVAGLSHDFGSEGKFMITMGWAAKKINRLKDHNLGDLLPEDTKDVPIKSVVRAKPLLGFTYSFGD